MAKKSGGINLAGVATATGGLILVYFAIRNIRFSAGMRELLTGQLPQPVKRKPFKVTFTGTGTGSESGTLTTSGATGSKIADTALKYKGVPYVWAGETPDGWDCSGFVTYVLHHDLGMNLPNNEHTVVSQFMTWSAATRVPRSEAMPGDLVIYPATHMGIAISKTQMIHAPTPGEVTKVSNIYGAPLFYRVGMAVT